MTRSLLFLSYDDLWARIIQLSRSNLKLKNVLIARRTFKMVCILDLFYHVVPEALDQANRRLISRVDPCAKLMDAVALVQVFMKTASCLGREAL